jgi:lipoate-protein ligase A
MFLFPQMQLWEDISMRSPAQQMACDEAMARFKFVPQMPVLRLYQWAKPAMTFGYAQRLALAQTLGEKCELMRRWTGGGVVFHGADLTLGLAIPASHEMASLGSPAIYKRIHEVLVLALRELGTPARLVLEEECLDGPACFQSPAKHDIMDGNSKICGGALRRFNDGVLYQGSLHLNKITGKAIAARLAKSLIEFSHQAKVEADASRLVLERYGTREWLELR